LNADFNGRFYGHLLPAKPQNVPLGFRLLCQSSDSVGDLVGNDRNLEFAEGSDDREVTFSKEEKDTREQDSAPSLEELRDLLNKATKELEVASLNSTMFEEKAQRISEVAIALKDEAASAWNDVNQTLNVVQEAVDEESVAKEAVQKATMALSLAEARLQVALESLEAEGYNTSEESEVRDGVKDKEEALLSAKADIKECQENLASCEEQLRRLQVKKDELQKEVDRLNEAAERAQISALKAEEDVANIMVLAEQAVAFELEATQRVNDAEIALQRAEKTLFGSQTQETTQGKVLDGKNTIVGEDEVLSEIVDVSHQAERDLVVVGVSSDVGTQSYESDNENGKPTADFAKEAEGEAEKSKNVVLTKKQEVQKDLPRESSSHNGTKTSLKKSSRFFPASFFSSNGDGTATVFESLVESAKQQWPKLILGFTLLGAGVAIYSNGVGRNNQLPQQPNIVSTSAEDVSSSTKPLIRQMQKLPKRIKKLLEMFPQQEVNEEEASLLDVLWLLLASVIFVPLFQKIPGGSPVLGYLAAGILIGPYGLSIIRNVHGTKAIAEFGVVFLLFNIGLELSVERLSSMKKYVFGLGSAQVLVTAAVIGLITHYVAGQAGPAAIVIGNGLALSSTAVVLQVLQERGESTSRHGRATFSVLLFQDLAVVVLLILIPLISPNSSKGGIGFQAIAEALGLAAIKAAVAITGIIAGGRLLLRPIYKQIAENRNAEIFSANTLLVILGTSLLTARAGLSMALGAFLAGLLLAETEFSLQVESDIAPYRGLLLGLFFMTVICELGLENS
jgi:monovalent cation:proton antiporter-2 (CPA2) family protein